MSTPAHEPAKKRQVSIYGSCVSRDTFEFFDKPEFALKKYVARQSLISAYGAAVRDVDGLDLTVLTSRFQRRMLEDDARSSLPTDLKAMASATDLLLWDITDERLGVYEIKPGTYLTRTVELMQSGLDAKVARSARLIPFGTDEHFELWCNEGLEPFLRDLNRVGILPRTRLLAVPWATADDAGRPSPSSFGMSASEANSYMSRYAAQVKGRVVAITPDSVCAVASSTHRWGVAPFHYVDALYTDLVDQLSAPLTSTHDGAP